VLVGAVEAIKGKIISRWNLLSARRVGMLLHGQHGSSLCSLVEKNHIPPWISARRVGRRIVNQVKVTDQSCSRIYRLYKFLALNIDGFYFLEAARF